MFRKTLEFTLKTCRILLHSPRILPNTPKNPLAYARQLLVGFLISGLLLLSPGSQSFVLAQTQPDAFAASLAQLEAFLNKLEALQEQLDPTQFDLDALSFELAFEDAETITAYVRDNILFEQYPGLLRGAEGTLMSRAGNALDQAVLLATLLGDAGYETQIARTTLTEAQAEGLLMALNDEQAQQAPLSGAVALLEVDETVLLELQRQAEERLATLRHDTEAATALLQTKLQEAGVSVPGEGLAALVEEARDYFWVEYRLHSGDTWQAAHVVSREAPALLATLEASEVLTTAVPEALQHRFRFRVFIEQRLGDRLEVHSLMPAWERPVANLVGVALTYTNLPDGLQSEADLQLSPEALLEQTSFFVPFFQDALPDGARLFSLDGNPVDPLAASSPAAGVLQTVGSLFGGAAGALAGEEDPDAFVTITAQWLEYTLIAPGGEETTERRMVFDRLGRENRAANQLTLASMTDLEVARALQTIHTFMVDPGVYSQAYVTAQNLSATLAAGEHVKETLVQAAAGSTELPTAPDVGQTLDHLNLFATFADFPRSAPIKSYRHSPGLVVIEHARDGSYARVDIVHNSRRTLRLSPDTLPSPAPFITLEAGVWETRTEGLVLARGNGTNQDTFTAIAAAQEQGVRLVTLLPEEMDSLELDVPAASLAAIRDDLAAGYVVITPERLPSGTQLAWWRVQPQTGETLGRGGDGRGQALTEYETLLRMDAAYFKGGLILAGTRAVPSCFVSGAASGITGYACCMAENVLITGAGIVLGTVLGGLFGVSAAVLHLALDIGVGTGLLIGGMTGALPSFCGALTGRCVLPELS